MLSTLGEAQMGINGPNLWGFVSRVRRIRVRQQLRFTHIHRREPQPFSAGFGTRNPTKTSIFACCCHIVRVTDPVPPIPRLNGAVLARRNDFNFQIPESDISLPHGHSNLDRMMPEPSSPSSSCSHSAKRALSHLPGLDRVRSLAKKALLLNPPHHHQHHHHHHPPTPPPCPTSLPASRGDGVLVMETIQSARSESADHRQYARPHYPLVLSYR
ncbi:unnamed protein product [Gadus morhua 'NCC']